MGANALTYSVRGGHIKTTKFLIDRQIEFDMIAAPCELSSMFVASLLGHDAILRVLSDRGKLTLQPSGAPYQTIKITILAGILLEQT